MTSKLYSKRLIHLFGNRILALKCCEEIRNSIMYNRYVKGQGAEFDLTQGEFWSEIYNYLNNKNEKPNT